MDEFEIIRRYFTRTTNGGGVEVGIGDDGAVLAPDAGRDLVAVVDTLVEDRHFPSTLAAADLGWRVVAVNLSDIAAMGAVPRWMTLSLTLSAADPEWLERFASGLFAAALPADVALVGGDTTRGAELVVSVQILGDVESGHALRRDGARAGDAVFVSGHPGEAAAGLAQLQANPSATGVLVDRFCRPQPRLSLGQALVGLATACIDVSDGLAGDLHKLLTASGVGADVDLAAVPISAELADYAADQAPDLALRGGDDYELCFTAPAADADAVLAAAAKSDTLVSRIGVVTAGPGLSFHIDGQPVSVDTAGYRHFGSTE